MHSNLGTEGMATEDGSRFSARSIPIGSVLHPRGTGADPAGEGVCYWLTRFNRHDCASGVRSSGTVELGLLGR
jgi:hypothetical protein